MVERGTTGRRAGRGAAGGPLFGLSCGGDTARRRPSARLVTAIRGELTGVSPRLDRHRKHWLVGTVLLPGTMLIPAACWAACSTSTPPAGTTMFICPEDTVTVLGTNMNPNNPSTRTQYQRFPNAVSAQITSGARVTGYGLNLGSTGGGSITVTNNGLVQNDGNPESYYQGEPIYSSTALSASGSGGLLTYMGSGSVTNLSPTSRFSGEYALLLSNQSGDVVVGSDAVPITGNYTGVGGILVFAGLDEGFSDGTFIQNPGNISARFSGGSHTVQDAGITLETFGGNIDLRLTGRTVINTAVMKEFSTGITAFVNGLNTRPVALTNSVMTDAHIGSAELPFYDGIQVSTTFNRLGGSTTLGLTGSATIYASEIGVSVQSDGSADFTTSAGSLVQTIRQPGLRSSAFVISGTSINVNLSGIARGGDFGLFLGGGNGPTTVTVNSTGILTGEIVGLQAFNRNGMVNILNLGTISSPKVAADFAGTLQVGNGGTTGTLIGDVIDRGTLIFNRSDAVTFGGVVSDMGALRQAGPGMLTLSSASTYTGPTTVAGGTLSVTGSLASAVTVASGAALTPTGRIGGLSVSSGGSVSTTGTPSTLTVAGPVSFASGSTYRVAITPAGGSDRIASSGAAALAGGTVQVAAAPGAYTGNQSYSILTAQGGVSGTFSSATSSFALLSPNLSYTPTSVLLTLVRAPLVGTGQTINQRAVARALDAAPLSSPLLLALAGTVMPTNAAFDAVSGEIHASVQEVLVDESRRVRDAALDRLRTSAGALGLGAQSGPAVWAELRGGWFSAEGGGNAAVLDSAGSTAMFGADASVLGGFRVGVAYAHTWGEARVPARLSNADWTSEQVGAYAGRTFGPLALRVGGAYAWHDIDTERSIFLPSFQDRTQARYKGTSGQVFGELAWKLNTGAATTEAYGQLAGVRLNLDGFAERGGAAALTGAKRSFQVGYSELGLRSALPIVAGVSLTGTAAWQHTFSDQTPGALLAESTGSAFTVLGPPMERDAARVSAGLAFSVFPGGRLDVGYTGVLGVRSQGNELRARLAVSF